MDQGSGSAFTTSKRFKNDRRDPTLSDTIRVLLLDHFCGLHDPDPVHCCIRFYDDVA
jgi:hypothetical protein